MIGAPCKNSTKTTGAQIIFPPYPHPTPTDSKIRIKNERILPVGVKGVIGGERIGGRGRGTREGPPPPNPPPMDTPRLPDAP